MPTVLHKKLGDGVLDRDGKRMQLVDATSDVTTHAPRVGVRSERTQPGVEKWSGELPAYFDVHLKTFEGWLADEHARLAEMLQETIIKFMPLESSWPRITLAKSLVTLDPLREASHILLMRAYPEGGEPVHGQGHGLVRRSAALLIV